MTGTEGTPTGQAVALGCAGVVALLGLVVVGLVIGSFLFVMLSALFVG